MNALVAQPRYHATPAAVVSALTAVLFCTQAACPQSVTLSTHDGMAVTFSSTDGSVTAVTVDGVDMPLIPDAPGGLALQVGYSIAPSALCALDFDVDGGPWTSAQNANWDGAGSFVTWIADGGIGGTGHLRLGDGVATGAGMAMSAPVGVQPGSTLKISWQARAASTATTQILCVRIFDAHGVDITSATAAPSGWGWTSTSQAHAVPGLYCSLPNTWECFEQTYTLPPAAAAVRVSLRHWTGGDHLLHIDDLHVHVIGGIQWSSRIPVLGPVYLIPGGFAQSVDVPGHNLRVDTTLLAASRSLNVGLTLFDTTTPQVDRPLLVTWTLPVAATGWNWWDDIDTYRTISPGATLSSTFAIGSHTVSTYPFTSVTSADVGLSLAVPQDEPLVQRFECDAATGLQSVWELALSALTTKLGPGRATVSLAVYRHDGAWGFRAATEHYYGLFPDSFLKRTVREGAWMYPIHPSQIPNPEDFGFAYHETNPITATERATCAQYGIGVFYYSEPWLAWQPWGNPPDKPSYDERMALMQSWADGAGGYAMWLSDGGVGGSGHLLLGDGTTAGAGMATATTFPVSPGRTVNISWQARVADTATNQIISVRLFNAAGSDITSATPAPTGWFFSTASLAHVIPGLVNSVANTWEPFSRAYTIPAGVAAMRVSLRHWNAGDHLVHIDDLRVQDAGDSTTYLLMDFNADHDAWVAAVNSNWEDPGPVWLRAPREESAQAIINSLPHDADGRCFIDANVYLWHEWDPNSWSQAWPVNPDPDLESPNTFELYREHWILYELAENDGVYIDSVITTTGVGDWENRRLDHLVWADSPLTFSWGDGGAAQLAPQAQAEFLSTVGAEVHGYGKLMMLNLFPQATRFHAYNADVMGSEVFGLVEDDALSRLRRTLARQRIVSNLLQWGWDSPVYATYDQMEQFIRGQLFWGFYPAVSSAGGMLNGGAPDRYFLHPGLYERDRPLFQYYVPLIRTLSSAGWEPVTNATATPVAGIERFGDFRRGAVLLTVRGPAATAVQAEITLDLAACGLSNASRLLEAYDLASDQSLTVELLSDPARARFNVELDAGVVGVYQFTPVPCPPGDSDLDGDVDGEDYAALANCLSPPALWPDPLPPMTPQNCTDMFDADGDHDVDLSDVAAFQASFTGSLD